MENKNIYNFFLNKNDATFAIRPVLGFEAEEYEALFWGTL